MYDLSNYIKRLCVSVSLCASLSVCHAHYSAVLSPFGKPEVSLEPYRRGHSTIQVSKNFTLVFTQFHAISRNLGYFSHFWANLNMLAIKKYVLQLRNSLVVLVEAAGLQTGT